MDAALSGGMLRSHSLHRFNDFLFISPETTCHGASDPTFSSGNPFPKKTFLRSLTSAAFRLARHASGGSVLINRPRSDSRSLVVSEEAKSQRVLDSRYVHLDAWTVDCKYIHARTTPPGEARVLANTP